MGWRGLYGDVLGEEDFMVMWWPWNWTDQEISDTCMFLPITKDILEFVQHINLEVNDPSQVFDVKIKTLAMKQGNNSDNKNVSE